MRGELLPIGQPRQWQLSAHPETGPWHELLRTPGRCHVATSHGGPAIGLCVLKRTDVIVRGGEEAGATAPPSLCSRISPGSSGPCSAAEDGRGGLVWKRRGQRYGGSGHHARVSSVGTGDAAFAATCCHGQYSGRWHGRGNRGVGGERDEGVPGWGGRQRAHHNPRGRPGCLDASLRACNRPPLLTAWRSLSF